MGCRLGQGGGGSLNASARTSGLYKKEGKSIWMVERYITIIHKRIDLFHLFDLIALDDGIVGIQVTTAGNHSGHRKDMLDDPDGYLIEWFLNGGKAELHSWGKKKVKRGGKAVRWTLRRDIITEGDL